VSFLVTIFGFQPSSRCTLPPFSPPAWSAYQVGSSATRTIDLKFVPGFDSFHKEIKVKFNIFLLSLTESVHLRHSKLSIENESGEFGTFIELKTYRGYAIFVILILNVGCFI
jgi:hypothetical protein